MIQRDFKFVSDDFTVIDGKKKLNKQVLLQSFKDFCIDNMTSSEDKKNFDRVTMQNALCHIASGKKNKIWNIKIYETVGLNREELLSQDDMDEKYLDIYNQKLNLYGLSINERFTKNELEELRSSDPNYERKKQYK